MNPTQVGDLLKQFLLASGVSGTLIGYFTSEMWVAIGGLILTVSTAIWQYAVRKTPKLIAIVADTPEVAKIVVHDPGLAIAIPSAKVVAR